MSQRTLPVPELPIAAPRATPTEPGHSGTPESKTKIDPSSPGTNGASATRLGIEARSRKGRTLRFQPLNPEIFECNNHPLAIRRPIDVLRFFPITITAGAVFAAASGFLAGKIVQDIQGDPRMPALFVIGYLAVYTLCLLTHYFAAKGKLFFSSSWRYTRVAALNALLLIPHYLLHTFLVGIATQ